MPYILEIWKTAHPRSKGWLGFKDMIMGYFTTNGNSQDTPDPLCLAAIDVGPPKEGIQKKPSVNNPFDHKNSQNQKCSLISMI